MNKNIQFLYGHTRNTFYLLLISFSKKKDLDFFILKGQRLQYSILSLSIPALLYHYKKFCCKIWYFLYHKQLFLLSMSYNFPFWATQNYVRHI